MKSQFTENGKLYETFKWKINNFSNNVSPIMYSEDFLLNGDLWRLVIDTNTWLYYHYYCQISLEASNQQSLSSGPRILNRGSSFKLTLDYNYNQLNSWTIVTREIRNFNASKPFDGFISFIKYDELSGESSFTGNGNNTCSFIVTAEMISVVKSEPVDQVFDSVVSKKDVSSVPTKFVDFKGLGMVEKTFVPLLEEVCSLHPSLVEGLKKKNRTRVFTEWAFTALGRVLHFLKTNKVKDTNDDVARKELEILWEELQSCGFDLSWLEPDIESALGMKGNAERVAKVKRLKEKVDGMENDLKVAKSKLAEAEEGFLETDLEAEAEEEGYVVLNY